MKLSLVSIFLAGWHNWSDCRSPSLTDNITTTGHVVMSTIVDALWYPIHKKQVCKLDALWYPSSYIHDLNNFWTVNQKTAHTHTHTQNIALFFVLQKNQHRLLTSCLHIPNSQQMWRHAQVGHPFGGSKVVKFHIYFDRVGSVKISSLNYVTCVQFYRQLCL